MPSYVPLEGRVRAVTVVFAGIAIVHAAAAVVHGSQLPRLDRPETVDSVVTVNLGAAAAGVLATVAGAVVFIRWLHAAYRNLDVVAPSERRYRRWWAIAGWFVPIMNFWRPKEVVNDLWRAGARDENDAEPGALLLSWWLLWLVSWWLLNRPSERGLEAGPADEVRTGTVLLLVSDVLAMTAAGLAILVVRGTTDRLGRRVPEPARFAPGGALGSPSRALPER